MRVLTDIQKEANRERLRKWKRRNPEKVRASARRSYWRNPEKFRAKSLRTAQAAHQRNPEARSARVRKRYKKNPEIFLLQARKWRLQNPEKSNAIKYAWRKRNPEKVLVMQNKRRAQRYPTDVGFRLTISLRNRFREAVKNGGGQKSGRTLGLLGCSVLELKIYLEKQFLPGMTWENNNFCGWHIDHIRPCASFDLTDPEQQKLCFHYTNLQPLWAIDNRRKGARW